MKIAFIPAFIKKFNRLEISLQNEILDKTELFKGKKNHKVLRVHKLHGDMKNNYAFSVNYKYRIIFAYLSKDEAVFLAIGDHDIYN